MLIVGLAVIVWRGMHPSPVRRWATVAVLCAIALITWIFPRPLLEACDRVGTYVHFELHRRYYEKRVAEQGGTPKIAIFPRGGMPWSFDGIVYDATDEVQLAPEARSPAWRQRASRTELSCNFEVRPLGDHFYAAHFFC